MPETPSKFSEFDMQAASEALGAESHPMHDVAHGDGEALTAGEAVLEVYRDAGVTRVTTPDARIELFRVPSYSISAERVLFEQGTDGNRSRLLVGRDGKVSFRPVVRATESSRTSETPPNGHHNSPTPSMPSENLTGRENRTTTPSSTQTTTLEGAKNGEVEQQVLQGRLGRDPWFNSDGDQQIAGFPLAVHNENETVWHKVVVFDATADQLQQDHSKGVIRKGRLVDVTGQIVIREEPKPSGGVKKIPEFHASRVTRVTSRTVPVRPKG